MSRPSDDPRAQPAAPEPEADPHPQPSVTLTADDTLSRRPVVTDEWTECGRYRLVREYARGGLGRILEAEDVLLDRTVAVKQLLARDKTAEARFRREARITAKLEHPAIVPIHDLVEGPGGEPYYAMKLISGQSLRDAVKAAPDFEARLGLLSNVLAVAEAIAYAHSKRIIHRDLKPANVVVGPFGETVVIDWGLAKELGSADAEPDEAAGPYRARHCSDLTSTGAILGTPAYMPPEQARGVSVDERADVYALGALLYHVIAGRAPYAGSTSRHVLRELLSWGPKPIDRLEPRVPPDLAAIVKKAMALVPAKRYRTAASFAQDLKAFLDGKLVAAHRYTIPTRIRRWFARHRAIATVTAATAIVVALGGLLSVKRIIRERDAAAAAKLEAIDKSEALTIQRAAELLDKDPTHSVALLKQLRRDSAHWSAASLIAADARQRGVAAAVLRGSGGPITHLDLAPGGRFVAFSGDDNVIHVHDLHAGTREEHRLAGSVTDLRFFDEGRGLMAAAASGQIALVGMETGELTYFDCGDSAITALTVSTDEQVVAVGMEDGTVAVWNVPGRRELLSTKAHEGPVAIVAISSTNRLVASGGRDGRFRMIDTSTREEVTLVEARFGSEKFALTPTLASVAFVSDDEAVAYAGHAGVYRCPMRGGCKHADVRVGMSVLILPEKEGGLVRLIDRSGGIATWDADVGSVEQHQWARGEIAFFEAVPGGFILAGFLNGLAVVWSPETGEHWELRGHAGAVRDVAADLTARLAVSAADDGTVRVWNLDSAIEPSWLELPPRAETVMLSDDGRLLVAYSQRSYALEEGAEVEVDNWIRVMHAATDAAVMAEPSVSPYVAAAFSSDSSALAAVTEAGRVRVWQPATGERMAAFEHDLTMHEGTILWMPRAVDHRRVLALSHDGGMIASGAGGVMLFDRERGRRLFLDHEGKVACLAFSSDGSQLAVASTDGSLSIWPVRNAPTRAPGREDGFWWHLPDEVLLWDYTRRVPRRLDVSGPITSCTASSGTLALGRADGAVAVLEVAAGDVVWLKGHSSPVTALAFSADGRALASGAYDGTLWVWRSPFGSGVYLGVAKSGVTQIAWSPWEQVATVSRGAAVTVWDARSGHRVELQVYRLTPRLKRRRKDYDLTRERVDQGNRPEETLDVLWDEPDGTAEGVRRHGIIPTHDVSIAWTRNGRAIYQLSSMFGPWRSPVARWRVDDLLMNDVESLERVVAASADGLGNLTPGGSVVVVKAQSVERRSVPSNEPLILSEEELPPFQGSPLPLPPLSSLEELDGKRLSDELSGIAELCLQRDGSVAVARIVETSGDAAYDAAVLAALRDRRYREPSNVPGVGSICARILFRYEDPRSSRLPLPGMSTEGDIGEGDLARVVPRTAAPMPGPTAEMAREVRRRRPSYALGRLVVCLSPDGRVVDAGLWRSSGFSEYDAAVLEAVRKRSYSPLKPSGTGQVACRMFTFGFEFAAGVEALDESPAEPFARRLYGKKYIVPSDDVKRQMADAKQREIRATVRLCTAGDGTVARTRVERSSGYPSYDETLVNAVAGWRYEPYLVGDEVRPHCHSVEFVFNRGGGLALRDL